jgi:hypothetical protein
MIDLFSSKRKQGFISQPEVIVEELDKSTSSLIPTDKKVSQSDLDIKEGKSADHT